MLIVFGPVVVLWIEVAILPCGDCRTGGLVIQVTAGQGKANPFLPRIFADERRSKAKAFTAKDQRNAKEEGHDSFFCFNLSPQRQAVIYVEHGNLD